MLQLSLPPGIVRAPSRRQEARAKLEQVWQVENQRLREKPVNIDRFYKDGKFSIFL